MTFRNSESLWHVHGGWIHSESITWETFFGVGGGYHTGSHYSLVLSDVFFCIIQFCSFQPLFTKIICDQMGVVGGGCVKTGRLVQKKNLSAQSLLHVIIMPFWTIYQLLITSVNTIGAMGERLLKDISVESSVWTWQQGEWSWAASNHWCTAPGIPWAQFWEQFSNLTMIRVCLCF